MRYDQTCEDFAALARRQADLASKAPGSFFAGAMLAGAFVGAAMILSLSVGAHLDPAVRPLAMGGVFGISILLVIFGGGELFTGQVMFASFALLRGKLTMARAVQFLLLAWLGNLCGSTLVCTLFAIGGGGHVYEPTPLLHDLVALKGHSSAAALMARAILCNWLACLGIWTASRLKSDSAKMLILAWCVMAYVTCGLEHSIANMALFALGLLSPVPAGDLVSAIGSVVIVSIGNMIGGGLLVGGAYAFYSHGERTPKEEAPVESKELHLPHMAPAVRDSLAEIASAGLARAA